MVEYFQSLSELLQAFFTTSAFLAEFATSEVGIGQELKLAF
jgi:hypothetical protein